MVFSQHSQGRERLGGWVQTATGRKFWPGDPHAEDVFVRDIAHALANICRFQGHTSSYYSVAQHSVLVSLAVEAEPSAPCSALKVLALAGLLHDAAEAYLADLSRPVKQMARAEGVRWFDQLESRIQDAIHLRFGIGSLSVREHAIIHHADILVLTTESRDLMSPLAEGWIYQAANGYPVLPEPIVPLLPEAAEWLFLERFAALWEGGPHVSVEPVGV